MSGHSQDILHVCKQIIGSLVFFMWNSLVSRPSIVLLLLPFNLQVQRRSTTKFPWEPASSVTSWFMEVHWGRGRGKRVSRGRRPFTGPIGHETDWRQHTDSPYPDNFTTGKQTQFKPCFHKRGGKSIPPAATPQFAEGIHKELKQVPSNFSHSRHGRRQHTVSYIPVQEKQRWTPPVLSVSLKLSRLH